MGKRVRFFRTHRSLPEELDLIARKVVVLLAESRLHFCEQEKSCMALGRLTLQHR
jgi:hypothetical protein